MMKTGLIAAIVLLALGVGAEAKTRICPMIVLPVCAVDASKQLQTYNNGCLAVSAGATVLHTGQCNGTFCPFECVADKGVYARSVETRKINVYDNLCWAEKGFAVFVHYGKCPWQLQ
ncbi:MAG TPA: hypothetical protein VIJ06_03040 [Methylovirgula sp.]